MKKGLSKRLLNYVRNDRERDVIEARLVTTSNAKAAECAGVHRRTADRIVLRVTDRAIEAGEDIDINKPNILVLDIETAPMLSYLWSLWQKGVNHSNQMSRTYMLSWAAKWLGEDEVMYGSLFDDPDYEPGMEQSASMTSALWNLMDDADWIVAHNGDKFDIKRINSEFLLLGMDPPSPYKSIDTLKIAKRQFGFDSNALDYLLRMTLGTRKSDSGGMDTWIGCLRGDPVCWARLVDYNKDDVRDLESLYMRIRAWDRSHPSAATWAGPQDVPVCTVCSSENVSPTGKTTATGASVFEVWRCNDCGHTMRDRKSQIEKEQREVLLMNAPQ